MAKTGSDDAITFVISVAAELAGMHPQTLRQYDRLGLVIPARTKGRGGGDTERGGEFFFFRRWSYKGFEMYKTNQYWSPSEAVLVRTRTSTSRRCVPVLLGMWTSTGHKSRLPSERL